MGTYGRPALFAGRADRSPTAGRPSEQKSPEEVFLVWLLNLPDDADVAQAARAEIVRLDRAASLHAGPRRLRELMVEATRPARSPRRRRRGLRPAAGTRQSGRS